MDTYKVLKAYDNYHPAHGGTNGPIEADTVEAPAGAMQFLLVSEFVELVLTEKPPEVLTKQPSTTEPAAVSKPSTTEGDK